MGIFLRSFIEDALPSDWTWTGRRVLDFGCGAGRVLRHFASEAADGEFWGCDIDGPSIEWLRRNLCPPLHPDHLLQSLESPGLPLADGSFDLIYAISVYTHLTDDWAGWLLEHHRLLTEGGLLLATFLGEGAIEKWAGQKWNEDGIGMNALKAGTPWDLGGPITLHSPWWLRAHWGRAFDVLALRPGGEKPGSHGLILLRRKPVHLTVEDLERLEPDEPREVSALRHHVQQLRDETLELRRAIEYLEHRLSATEDGEERIRQLQDELRRTKDLLEAIRGSASWRLTAPLRAAVAALTQNRARR
jgi:SAM-dependent methyltransferase